MQSGQNAITTKRKTPATAEPNFHLQHIICIKGTPLFKEGAEYYCFADTGEYFWLYLPVPQWGIDQVKVTSALKENFRISNYFLQGR